MSSSAHVGSPHEPDDPARLLLGADSLESYVAGTRTAVERVAACIGGAADPVTGADRDTMRRRVAAVDLARPLGDPDAVLDELDAVYLRDAVYFHHPRYLAHLNCPVVVPAVVAETVISALNSSLDTFDQSVGGTVIEQRLVRWACDLAGLGPDADGVFTSGGTQSNLEALAIARDEARERYPADRRLRILTSACSHFSVDTAAKLLGLPADAVRAVAVDDARRMRVDALRAELERARADGDVVMAVVATAGTTDFGSLDPLASIADACAAAGTWLHVDAAWGCGLLVSPTRRRELAGIERADSVTLDFHKSFFQPVSSSAVLVRHADRLGHVSYHADYLNPADGTNGGHGENQVDKSLQTTRRFDALKLWMTLRQMGATAVGELFDRLHVLADAVWERLDADPRFEVVVRPQLSSLVFRWVAGTDDEDARDALVPRVRAELFGAGEAVVGSTVVDGREYLKFTLLNPTTTVAQVMEVVEMIATHAAARTPAVAR